MIVIEWVAVAWALLYVALFVVLGLIYVGGKRREPDPVSEAERVLANSDRFIDWHEKGWM